MALSGTFAVLLLAFFALVLHGSTEPLGGDLQGRKELTKKIFEDYDKDIIPDNVTVKLAISLQHVELNSEKSELESQIHLIQCWTDTRLAWDNSTNGINVLHLSPDKIWKPDVVLYNSADFKNMQNCQEVSKVIVFSNGYTLWIAPCQLRSHCNFTSAEACGDQHCQWKFASWIYDKEMLDMNLVMEDQGISLDEFGSQKWKIVETNATRNERTFGGYPNAYADLTFNLAIAKVNTTGCI